jgi:ABC-type amino acid transport substrate-binding protein
MQNPNTHLSSNSLFRLSMIVAVFSMAVAIASYFHHPNTSNPTNSHESVLQRIKREGVIRVGYGGFSPYTIIDTKETDPNKRVKGFAADIVNEIAARSVPKLKVEWQLMNWDTLRTDMLSKKFDFIADPIYQTIPRAMEFDFTEPYSYFGIGLGVVRKNEQRFKTFQDLDKSDVNLVVAEGWVSTEYAKAHLTKPKMRTIPVGGDAFTQLDDVLMGRSDAAVQDSPTAVQYAKAHPDKVKVLWADHPPTIVPGGFSVRHEDRDLFEFLNTCLRILKTDGTIANLDKKWKTYGYMEEQKIVPAAGLREYLNSDQHKHEL